MNRGDGADPGDGRVGFSRGAAVRSKRDGTEIVGARHRPVEVRGNAGTITWCDEVGARTVRALRRSRGLVGGKHGPLLADRWEVRRLKRRGGGPRVRVSWEQVQDERGTGRQAGVLAVLAGAAPAQRASGRRGPRGRTRRAASGEVWSPGLDRVATNGRRHVSFSVVSAAAWTNDDGRVGSGPRAAASAGERLAGGCRAGVNGAPRGDWRRQRIGPVPWQCSVSVRVDMERAVPHRVRGPGLVW
ncbi:MAG: hypothetical protein OXQ29_10795 [Rhodospirillaceae bacterium]|nr:hypothetical protein [Rhodospirillaceae bacterium]